MKDFVNKKSTFRFVSPIDGDCIMSKDLITAHGKDCIPVRIYAPCGKTVTVNGIPAVADGGYFAVNIPVSGKKTELSAVCDGMNESITVYDARMLENKFIISSDDNIIFLKDITDNKDRYKSVFENPYLAVYKRAHDMYGAKVHLNLFYEIDDMPHFNQKFDYFNLSMMTDKFKSEFEANSDWLHFSFHARSEMPDKPYRYTSALRIGEDIERINNEIIRFAGKKSLSDETTVHWGEANYSCLKELRDRGYRSIAGYFEKTSSGNPLVAYCYPAELVRHVGGRDFWKNTELDIMHGRIDLVLNTIKREQLETKLQEIYDDVHRAGFIWLMIHEQYFYPEYELYIPEFADIVVSAAKWVYERGYRGTFTKELYED